MKKWTVKKRDGVWVVLDQAGRIRYAADNHFMALSFALMKNERRTDPSPLDIIFRQSGLSWSDAIARWVDMKNDEEDKGCE